MQPVGLEHLREHADDYDRAVRRADSVDRFCTSSAWVLPAYDELMPARDALVFREDDRWLLLARGAADRGIVFVEPLEAMWGLSCPLVGAEPDEVVGVVEGIDWNLLLVTGVLDDTGLSRELASALARKFALRRGQPTERFVADLGGGFDGYLSRRSRNQRRSMRRARARAEASGIEFEVADGVDPQLAFERISAVEADTWKGRLGIGLIGSGMGEFYRAMMARLSARGALRLRFGRRDGRDESYILGGVFAGTYRGLQFGYRADCAELGLGNASQLSQIEALCEEGIGTYDLGTTGEGYKPRWADRVVTSTAWIAVR